MKIVVVDDNADGRELLCALLTKLGNEVVGAANGQMGLDIARQTQPDAVILDITLPDMNGYDLAVGLRSECGLQSVRLIALQWPDARRGAPPGGRHRSLRPQAGSWSTAHGAAHAAACKLKVSGARCSPRSGLVGWLIRLPPPYDRDPYNRTLRTALDEVFCRISRFDSCRGFDLPTGRAKVLMSRQTVGLAAVGFDITVGFLTP